MSDDYITKRTIEEVFDVETGDIIKSEDFFKQSEADLMKYRRRLQEAISGFEKPKFKCLYCNQLLKISGKATRRGEVSFFSHLHDSDECEIKTDNKLSKEQIEILKYSKVRESYRHKDLKNKIYKYLTDKASIKKGVENVAIEKRVISKLPYFNWRQPDISFDYNGKKVVIELQLSTTFLSVIVERDIFYKMNEIFIIWVFNFSENQQYVNLGNLMCKDIYYSNKRNAFILDEDAMDQSIQKNELILKCVWFEPKITDGKFDPIKSIKKEEFVSITDLKFNQENFKPYYFDADSLFNFYQPELKIQRKKEEEHIQKSLLKHVKQRDIKLSQFRSYYSKDWGFKNESGVEVIPAQYSEVFPFNEGISWVKKTYWGAIDTLGHKVVNFQYKEIRMSNNYIFARNKKGMYGILSNEGYIIVPFEYSKITDFVDGKARANEGGYWGVIDEDGNTIVPFEYNEIRNFVDGEAIARKGRYYGCIDKFGNAIIPFEYDEIRGFVDGKAIAYKERKYGSIDEFGNTIIPFEYDEIEGFVDGKAIASKERKYGCIDKFGNTIIPFEYDGIRGFVDGKAIASKGRSYGCIDEKGNPIIDNYIELENGKIQGTKFGKWGVQTKDGEVIVPFEYDKIGDFVHGKAIAYKEGKYGSIDEFGNTIIPFEYNEIRDFVDGKAIASKEGKYGSIDDKGNPIIDNYIELENGKIKGTKFGKWGVQNKNGSIGIPFEYDEIEEFIDKKAKAQRDGYWMYIDEKGNTLIENEIYLEDGNIKGTKKGRWGIQTKDGEVIVPFENDQIETTIDNYVLIKSGKVQLFKQNGVIPKPVKCSIYETVRFGIFVKLNGVKGLLHVSELNSVGKKLYDLAKRDTIELYIKNVDVNQQRISFSLSKIEKLKSYPKKFTDVSTYKINSIHKGKVVETVNFGLFIELENNFKALLHISELRKHKKSLEEFKKGDSVEVRIINIDESKNRITLSF